MADIRAAHELLRPCFRGVLEKWPGTSVTAEDENALVIRRAESPTGAENVALIVIGENSLDPSLFERCAAYHMGRFLEDGWSIKLLDFGSTAGRTLAPGAVVAKMLAETSRLRYIVFLSHSRRSINLTAAGDDLVVDQAADGGPPGLRIAQLRLCETAHEDGWVDFFGCMCRPNARWPAALAKALNWPVRTVYPGHGIYFPKNWDYPRSAIPLTRAFFQSRYRDDGWAVWFPSAGRPVRVSEPGETATRHHNQSQFLEHLLVAIFSVCLEPLRDFRKRLRLAARVQKSPATPWSMDRRSIILEKAR